ncbi:MAG: hypothetical protein ACTS73_07860 [Arsenophonus sp. NEOnobi-MAG3]
MIYHEKPTLQLSAKPDITCDLLHELIRNSASHLIHPSPTLMGELKAHAVTTC